MNPLASRVVQSAAMTLSLRTLSVALLLGAGLLVAGCGAPDLGEACDTAGSLSECVDGAVCTNESPGNVCRKVCELMDDCPTGYSCNGVTGGSTKSCQPDPI